MKRRFPFVTFSLVVIAVILFIRYKNPNFHEYFRAIFSRKNGAVHEPFRSETGRMKYPNHYQNFIPINDKIGTFVPYEVDGRRPIQSDNKKNRRTIDEWEAPFNSHNEGYISLQETPIIRI